MWSSEGKANRTPKYLTIDRSYMSKSLQLLKYGVITSRVSESLINGYMDSLPMKSRTNLVDLVSALGVTH